MKVSNEDQVPGTDVQTSNIGTAERSEVHTSNVEIERKVISVDSSSTGTGLLTEPCHSKSCQDRDISTTSAVSSSVQQVLPPISESPMYNKTRKEENSAKADSEYGKAIFSGHKEERIVSGSSSESLPKLSKEMVVYLDDIEEFQCSPTKEEVFQDQRLFKFKSSVQSKKEGFQNGGDQSYSEKYESWNEKDKPGSKNPERTCSLSSRKRSRRRLVFQESKSMKDTECLAYYGQQPYKQRIDHQLRKQHKKILVEKSERRLNQFCSSEMGVASLSRNRRFYPIRPGCSCCSNHKMGNSCSLESPCYFISDEDDNDREVPPFWKQRNLSRGQYCRDHLVWDEELNDEIEWITIPQKPGRRSYDNGAMVYDVFTYPNHQIHSQNNEVKRMEKEFGSRGGRASSCRTRKDLVPPYLRTVTMPPERPKDNSKDDFQRSKSFPAQNPNHVHPKLPDYDDITATFMALKKENQLSKLHCRKQQL